MVQILNQLILFSKLLGAVFGPVSVEELVSVEDAPSARFTCYGRKLQVVVLELVSVVELVSGYGFRFDGKQI